MHRSKSPLWWRDSNQPASGKPGAVQVMYRRHGRSGFTEGRTFNDAWEELDKVATTLSDRDNDVDAIRKWLSRESKEQFGLP
jgi:hypothetical protein